MLRPGLFAADATMMDERAGQPARPKGGGPPGGSAFDRLGRVRLQGARHLLATDEAFAPTEVPAPPPQATSTPASEPAVAAEPRTFPGGRVTLPRLDGTDGCSVHLTGAAFRPDHTREETTTAGGGGYADYFTEESLFTAGSEPAEDTTGPPPAVVAAYKELRLPAESAWPEVVAQHRALVKEFHPDGYADQDAAVRDFAEAEIRKINNAYDTLRRHRREPD